MVMFGPSIVPIQPNSVCVIQVITWIHVKSFEKTRMFMPFSNRLILTTDTLSHKNKCAIAEMFE